MLIEQRKFSKINGWETILEAKNSNKNFNLVLAFGSRELLGNHAMYDYMKKEFPESDIVLSSTAGEIIDTQVNDNTISLTAIHFGKSQIKTCLVDISEAKSSYDAGHKLGFSISHEKLTSFLVISDGHQVNGSELVSGLYDSLPKGVILTGGLAGDGSDFNLTLVGLNDYPSEGKVVGIGFYGENLVINSGSMGGWNAFGAHRVITKSSANILYELDNEPALDIYKKYLGEYAKELPGAALQFPLSIRIDEDEHSVVRTILSINEEEKSLTFAGNMPLGAHAQLMKANYDKLIDGASGAAKNSINNEIAHPELAILISCVGRKLVLGHRVEEEIEAVRNIYGHQTALTGFYSYGEIAPSYEFMKCELHNQTMTITTFTEV